jgi:hypothetical protein
MGGGRARPRPRGLSAVIPQRGRPRAKRGKRMRTLTKAISVGPATVIVAASSRLPGTGGRRHKRKGSVFSKSAVPRAVASARMAVKQLERASMMLGAVAAGLELVREVRFAGSNGTPSGGYSSGRSAPRRSSQARSGRGSRMASSSGNRSGSKSPSRAGKKPSGNRNNAMKTRSTRTMATKRSVSRATTKKAGSARTHAKKQARSRTPAKRTRSRRSGSASRG